MNMAISKTNETSNPPRVISMPHDKAVDNRDACTFVRTTPWTAAKRLGLGALSALAFGPASAAARLGPTGAAAPAPKSDAGALAANLQAVKVGVQGAANFLRELALQHGRKLLDNAPCQFNYVNGLPVAATGDSNCYTDAPSTNHSENHAFPVAAVVGASIGGAVVILCMAAAIMYVCRRTPEEQARDERRIGREADAVMGYQNAVRIMAGA